MGRIYPTLPVAFPIDINIKSGGNTFAHRLNNGDRVKCWWCGSGITLNNDTVFRFKHEYDTNAKVECKICSRMTDIVYYCNDSNRVKLDAWDSGFVKTKMEEVV